MFSDLSTAVRMLWRAPGYVLVVVLTLGLGIGGVTAVFTLADPMIFRPLPWADAGRIVEVLARAPQSESLRLHADDFVLIEREATTLAAVATLTGPYLGQFRDRREPLLGGGVSAGFFPMTGLRPAVGRLFTPDEYERGENATPVVAMLTYGFWQEAFGGDPDVLGSKLEMSGSQPFAMEIVGVLPREFFYPQSLNRAPSYIVPGAMDPRYLGRRNVFPTTLARVRPDVTFEQAEAEIDGLLAAVEHANPTFEQDRRARLVPLQDLLFRSLRTPLLLLFIATGCLLMLAWVNLTHLAQARAQVRARDLAVRVALGAGRWRVTRLLLAEAALLSVLGAGAGILIGQAMFTWGFGRTPEFMHVYRLLPTELDLRVVGFAVALAAFAMLAIGLWPAVRSFKVDLRTVLSALPGRRRGWRIGGEALAIVGQTAFAVGLVVTCLLVVRSFAGMVTMDRGFDPGGVSFARVSLPREQGVASSVEMQRRMVEVLSRTPGIDAAAVGNGVPSLTLTEAVVGADGESVKSVVAFQVSAGFSKVMGMTLEEGRLFDEGEAFTGASVVVVDRNAADRLWPGERALGKTVRLRSGRDLVVVGVLHRAATNLREPSASNGTVLATMDTTSANVVNGLSLVVRLDPRRPPADRSIAEVLSREVPGVEWSGAAGLSSWSRYLGQPRFLASALAMLGTLTVVLAGFGVLGVVGHLVSRRTREIGIRIALGADRRRVRLLVMRQALVPAAVGVLAGLVLAFWWSESVRAVIVGVSPHDPWSFAGAGAATIVTVFAASLQPAIRASRIDPARTLRAE
ncbi:MAG TPA: ABC transporter permease [Vicinamibacterales bacterium]|nr:ABC transporter permease [Vicinamibacterales bacterium]